MDCLVASVIYLTQHFPVLDSKYTKVKVVLSESNLLCEKSDELSVVEHPIVVLIDHRYVLLGLLQTDPHPAVLREDLSQLLPAYTATE